MAKKRDRAAYMRDYRAKRKKDAPTLTSLAERVAVLEALILSSPMGDHWPGPTVELITPAANRRRASGFGSPRPAPKGK